MPDAIHKTVDHFFRHESGKVIAVLTKFLGLQHLQAAQDIAQDTLLQALHTWRIKGLPDNPGAWLYKVAKNKAVDFLRRENLYRRKESEQAYLLKSEFSLYTAVSSLFEEEEIADSQLRMIFACCHPSIPVDAQLALALKRFAA
jgi:RNA polymerase sigma-70 factor (ECF subfamily)